MSTASSARGTLGTHASRNGDDVPGGALLAADVARVVRELRAFGPLRSDVLARRRHAQAWHEGAFRAALSAGVAGGRLRRLGFGFLEAEHAGDPHPRIPYAAPAGLAGGRRAHADE